MTVLEGKPWKRQRSSITPFFSGARLNEQESDKKKFKNNSLESLIFNLLYRSKTPILSRASQKVLQDIVEPLIGSGSGIVTNELSKEYSMTAIMAAGFNIGKL